MRLRTTALEVISQQFEHPARVFFQYLRLVTIVLVHVVNDGGGIAAGSLASDSTTLIGPGDRFASNGRCAIVTGKLLTPASFHQKNCLRWPAETISLELSSLVGIKRAMAEYLNILTKGFPWPRDVVGVPTVWWIVGAVVLCAILWTLKR